MSAFSLRPMVEEDLPQVLEIERVSTRAPWTETHFRAEWEKPQSRSWVLTDDDTDEIVAGFVVFWVLGAQGHILEIATHPERRRQGFGRQLLQAAVKEAMRLQADEMILEVRKSNAAAIAFYQSLGFDIRLTRRQFYSDGEDAYVLSLGLQGPRSEF